MTGLLVAQDLSRSFGGLQALEDISFAVTPGLVVGVIGPNGAGKTTLLNLLSGQLVPSRGRLVIAGRDMTGAPAWRFARCGVVRTFQVPRSFGRLSMVDNVAVAAAWAARAPTLEARRRAATALERVGLGGEAGRAVLELSVAQTRRLELARALAAGPSVLVVDEILGGLPPAEVQEMLDLLGDLKAEGVAMVLVEHHLGAVRALCDRILALDRGRPLAFGPAQAVLADDRVVRAYLGGPLPGVAR